MIELIVAFVAGAVVSAVVSYLFLRANPNKKAAVDKFADEVSEKLKE